MNYTVNDIEKIGKDIHWLDFLGAPEFNSIVWEYWKSNPGLPQYWYHSNNEFDVPDVIGEERYFFAKRHGYDLPAPASADNSYINMYLAQPEDHPDFYQSVKEYFGLRYIDIVINNQEPGKVVGMHHDGHRSLLQNRMPADEAAKVTVNDFRKYIVFQDDQKPGHMFQWGTECVSNWKKWDIYSFPWYVPHGTANAGDVSRKLFVVAGVE